MKTVTDSNTLAFSQAAYADRSAAASGQANVDELNSKVQDVIDVMDSGNIEESVPSLISLLVELKSQVASLMLESKDLRKVLVEAKADLAIEQGIEELKKIDASKKSGIVGKLQSIIQPVLLAISCAAVVLMPTPLTVGLLVMSVGMYVDEEIARATGNDSLMTTMTDKMEAGLSAILPPDVVEVLAPLIVVVAMVVISVVASKGSMAMTGKFNSVPGFKQVQNFLTSKLNTFVTKPVRIGTETVEEAPQKVNRIAHELTNCAIAAGEVSQQAMLIVNSVYQYKTTQFQKSIEILDADMGEMEQMYSLLDKLLNEFMGNYDKSKSWSIA